MDIISRKEAKEQGLNRYFTGKPCKHGHVAERLVANRTCAECFRRSTQAWREANPEKVKGYSRAWAKANREKSRENSQAWRCPI